MTSKNFGKTVAGIIYKKVENKPENIDSGLPYVVMEGVLKIGEAQLRSYILSTGERVFDAEDVEKFFELLNNEISDAD